MTIRKHHPKWVDTAITPKRGKSAPRESWWMKAAAPDQRDAFIAAAHARHAELATRFVAGYAEADGTLDKC